MAAQQWEVWLGRGPTQLNCDVPSIRPDVGAQRRTHGKLYRGSGISMEFTSHVNGGLATPEIYNHDGSDREQMVKLEVLENGVHSSSPDHPFFVLVCTQRHSYLR